MKGLKSRFKQLAAKKKQPKANNNSVLHQKAQPMSNLSPLRKSAQPRTASQQPKVPFKRPKLLKSGLDLSPIESGKKHFKAGVMNNGSIFSMLVMNLMHHDHYKQQKNALYKQYNSETFQHTTIAHLGYKGLTHDDKSRHYVDNGRNYLELSDDLLDTSGFADIIKIGGASLSELPNIMILERMSMFINFLRAVRAQMNFISLPLPNNSRPQQHQWRQQLDIVQNRLINPQLQEHKRQELLARQVRIKEIIRRFQITDRNLINQGFVLMPYDSSIKALDVDVRLIFHFGQQTFNLSHMDFHAKEAFLRHFNNPNDVRTV